MSVATTPFSAMRRASSQMRTFAIDDAVERDLPHAGDGLEALLHLVARRVREHLPRERAGDAQGQDGGVVGV